MKPGAVSLVASDFVLLPKKANARAAPHQTDVSRSTRTHTTMSDFKAAFAAAKAAKLAAKPVSDACCVLRAFCSRRCLKRGGLAES